MLKKAVQQGRSERRAEAYPLGYVEGLSDARTPLADFFSILLERQSGRPPRGGRPVRHTGLWIQLGTDAYALFDQIKSFLG